MKLQFDQICAVTLGAAYVTEEQNGYRFHRFTAEQEALYRVRSADFYKKSAATSGIRLAWRTNSRSLRFLAAVRPASSRRFAFFDLTVNGESVAHLGTEQIVGEAVLGGRYELGEGEKTVVLYLPQLASAVLQELTLDDGCWIEPLPQAPKLLILGDSITQGYDARFPSYAYASRIADLLGMEARNKGIGGERFFPALAEASDTGFEPELVTVAYGTNDWSSCKAEAIQAEMTAFYRALSKAYPTAQIAAISPIWRTDWRAERPSGAFGVIHDWIRQVANDLPNVTCINGLDLIPHDPACFAPDGLHPNEIGFAYYAERLADRLQALREAHA